MTFATRPWAPSLWVLKLSGHSWFPFGKSGNVCQRHEEVGLAACGMSPPRHPPPMSQTRPSVERHGIKVLPTFNGCQMSNNDPFIHHLVYSIFIAADPLKCHPATLDQEPWVPLAQQEYSFQPSANGGRTPTQDLSVTTTSRRAGLIIDPELQGSRRENQSLSLQVGRPGMGGNSYAHAKFLPKERR